MFRGRPQRGGFPRPYGPPHHGHSPPGPGRPLPPGPYRERERHGYHHGYPEDYRRSPPRRRYPSPGSSSYRGPSGEYRGNGPPPPPRDHKRVTPSPIRGDVPVDRSLVITVGNELTGSQAPRGSRNTEHHYERDYHKGDPHYKHASGMRPGHEQESDSRYRRRSHSRGRSRPRSRSHSRGRERSKSRARSRSRSRGKSRARSRSRGRSKSRVRSRSMSRGRSRAQSRAQSRARSRLRESQSRSSSSSGSASSNFDLKTKRKEEFRELEMARRRKELEELLGAPTKSILKKRIDSETDSPAAVQSSDSPVDVSGEHQSSSLSRETERFLSAVTKGMESGLFTSMLGDMTEQPHDQRMQAMAQGLNLGQYQEILNRVKQETDGDGIGEFLLPHERVRQDSGGFSRILGGMGNQPDLQEKRKSFAEIEDEERFLYGEDEEGDKEKVAGQSHPATPARVQRSHSQSELSSPYGDGRPELAKYRDSKLAMSQYHDSKPEVLEYTGGQEYMQRCHSQAGVAHNLLSEVYAAAADSPYRHSSAASEDRLDARSLRGSHQQIQPDMRYHHRGQPIAATAQKDGGQVGAPQEEVQPEAYPPGLDPKETKERQEVEEYEKIQDLLKAIGLDLGVAEISKMAARTQERLHGKKPPAGPSRRVERLQDRRDRRKSHSSSSSSSSSRSPDWNRGRSRGHSRGRSQGRSRNRSHDSERRSASPRPSRRISLGETLTAPGRSESGVMADDGSWGIPVLGKGGPQPRITVSMNPPPSLASIPQQVTAMGAHAIQAVSGYQSQTPAYPMPTPNYPPPGYGQYEGYMPYVAQRWPMYPPPSLVVPPRSPVEEVPVSSASTRPYLRVIETVAMETKDSRSLQAANKASKPESGGGFTSQSAKEESSQSQRLSEEKNQASQKQKVIEEREKLKKERDVRMKKKEYLMKELERLRKQQGELLRKKRREKDGHKDPLLGELGRLQEEVMVQIASLRKEHEAAEKKRAELDKVALILGLGKHRKEGRASGEFEPQPERTPDKAPSTPSSSVPSSKATSTLRSSPEKSKPKSQHGAPAPEKSAELYEYYDSGNHWCKNCNTVCGSMFDFFTHLHSKSHKKTRDPYDRPWASNSSSKEKKRTPGEKIVRPAKGSEFLVPVIGFYCQLCEEFFGDQICAEEHVTCHKHNEKYKKRIDEHPMYEQRRNLDRQAGLSVATENRERKHGELKRKLETEPLGTQEDNPSSQGEETPPRGTYRDRRSQSSRDEKPTSYKDEKSYSHREEKLPRHRADRTSGHREERRASVKEEKEGRKRTPPVPEEKSEPQRPVETAEKQRVICGPSPSILAKVRKRNEEAVKGSASTSAFGKFSWKKPEKEKEQEYEDEKEEKAMENVTEEENDEDDSGDKEDGKSALAKAKTIEIKLSGKTIIPPSNVWVPFTSAQPALATKIRPILPAPMMVLRKSNPSSKPAPLTTFLSIKPSGTNSNKPLPVVKPQKDAMVTPDLISKAFGGEEVVLKAPEVPVKTMPASEKNLKKSTPDVKKPPAKPTAVAQPQEPPPPGMHMIFESDVAAPGVPVNEQTMTVVVCPPPLHMTEGPQKNDKPKSSLAAAKAQDLYDIFYSSGPKGTKQPKSGETTKSKDSAVCAPKTESESKMDVQDAQTPNSSIILQLDDQTLQIPSPEKDSPFTQLEMVDLDLFTFNFE